MYRYLLLTLSLFVALGASGQTVLSLDSCISMALRENKQLQIEKLNADIATNTRKAARTKYLPHITGAGGYMHTGNEMSILNDNQKNALQNIGTTVAGAIQGTGQQIMPQVLGMINQVFPEIAPKVQAILPTLQEQGGAIVGSLAQSLNQAGANIVNDFRTDTRDIFGAGVMLNQPLYMGGAITAGNRMSKIAEEISQIKIRKSEQDIIYNVQSTYYLVVEVEHKKQLADEYYELIKKLNHDVEKMIQEGVATRADGLKVSVKLNEAEMQQLQAEDGLTLSKMMLCKLCGMPLDAEIEVDSIISITSTISTNSSANNRPELQMLDKAITLYDQKIKSARAAHLPQVLLTGGYFASNPSFYNGFEKKFKGTWNVGVMMTIPLIDWNETGYKVRAAKAQSKIARMELADAQDLIDLQIQQTQFKLNEAEKKHTVTIKNFETAEENLRCANLGFAEGVMTTTDVMMAQTAWLQAKTQKIEAEIGVITAKLALNHAYGY